MTELEEQEEFDKDSKELLEKVKKNNPDLDIDVDGGLHENFSKDIKKAVLKELMEQLKGAL